MSTKGINVETISLSSTIGKEPLAVWYDINTVMMRLEDRVLVIRVVRYGEDVDLYVSTDKGQLTLFPDVAFELGFITKVELNAFEQQQREQQEKDRLAYERAQYEKLKAKFEGK